MNMKKKILFVFGTRPEAIKMAPAVMELKKRPQFDVKVCVTAQHRSMLDAVLLLFKIRPDYDLDIMQEGQSLEHITRQVIEKFPPVLKKEKPDLVLVHGDTSTTFLASLASFYQKVPVGHVEAGLRSYDDANPFPEELNRRLADDLCSLHFAPTEAAKRNLLKENIPAEGIFITGNTVIDALDWAVSRPHKFQNPELKKFMRELPKGVSLILVTAHRRENFGEPIQNICRVLKETAEKFENVRIVYPVHPNPNVKSVAMKILSNCERVCLLPPVDYLDLAHLIQKCSFVVTDSGGLQEEAPSLGKPVLVLRKVTERPEAVKAGTAHVVGTDRKKIVSEISKLLTNKAHYRRMANAVNPYGDGQASRRIADAVLCYFGLGKKPRDFRPK
jgi:UDP-N-acetylglucosamine 2-epimerase (non-hydrolysing)